MPSAQPPLPQPPLDWRPYLTRAPQVCHGALCAAGTRVMVTIILDSLAEGSTRQDILASYPTLRPEHIDAAVAYAASRRGRHAG